MKLAFAIYLASCAAAFAAMVFAPSPYWVLLGFAAGMGMSTALDMKNAAQQGARL